MAFAAGALFRHGGLSHAGRRGVSGRLPVEPGDAGKVPDWLPLRRCSLPEHARNGQDAHRASVPAHAAATEDIAPLAQYNIDKVLEIADIITELCQKPQTFEAVLQQLFRRFDLVMNFEQYVLVGSTVRSYLAWLKDSGRLRAVFDDNRLLWQQA